MPSTPARCGPVGARRKRGHVPLPPGTTGRLVVELASGATFTVPASPVEGLADAAPEALERIRVTPGGEGLHFPVLDADFGVPGLLAGVFGSKAWMRGPGRRAAG